MIKTWKRWEKDDAFCDHKISAVSNNKNKRVSGKDSATQVSPVA